MPKRKTHPEDITEQGAEEQPELVIESLRTELAETEEARKRALADFANYQRRAADNEARAALDGAASVVKSLMGVLDHFDLALDQDTDRISVDQLLGGVRIVRDDLLKVLESHGVQRIHPQPGDEFDPNRHEAVMRLSAEGIELNHIATVLQPGYVMGDLVLRPAKVAVAAPDDEGE